MITFADAKRIIKTVELIHGTESKFIDLFIELFTMLEESTAEQLVSMGNSVTDYEYMCNELKEELKSKEAELDELNAAFRKLSDEKDALAESYRKTLHEYERLSEAEQKPKRKPGRPKKNPEDAKAETYGTELEDLCEDFGVHDLAKDIFGGDD